MKPLTNSEISGILLQIESAISVNEFVYKNVDFWPYIKVSLIGRLRNIHVNGKRSLKWVYILLQTISTMAGVLKGLYHCYIVDAKANLKGRYYPNMILAPYDHRYDKANGGYLSMHADAIRDYCDGFQSIGLIEYDFSCKWRRRRASNSHLLTVMPPLLGLKYRILSVFGKSCGKWDIGTKRLNCVFKNEGIGIVLDPNNLLLEAKRVWEASLYCKKYLMKYQVKHLINIVYSNYISISFLLAARQLGIKTTEYQHGSQDEAHPIYSSWSIIGETGYQLLPENYWVWSKINQERIQRWAKCPNTHCVRITGNFYINRFLPNSIERTNTKVVLLTLQDPVQFPAFMYNVIANSPKEWVWLVKEHPRYKLTGPLWKRFKSTSDQIFNMSDEHLYTLFSKASVHITGYSTCAFEAEIFDLPTVFFDETARLGYDELIASHEHFVFAKDEREVINGITNVSDVTVKRSGYIEAASCNASELMTASEF